MYTKSEIDKLQENLRAIEEYCKSNICPAILPGRNLSVSFDGDIRGGTKKYTMIVRRDGSMGLLLGVLFLSFNADADHNVYNDFKYSAPLVLNWQEVKQRLNTQLQLQAEEHRKIMEFIV